MRYRKLGKTGLEVSAIGFGAAMLGSSNPDYAAKVVHRALELGVNYFDTARSYYDSEVKLGSALKGIRNKVLVSSKSLGRKREDAWRHIQESLERLQTDYIDNYHLHSLRNEADIEKRLGPGGAIEALIEARDQGLIRHIGCTSHLSDVIIKALERFDFEIIEVPMNIVEREPLETLIPLCERKGVGITVMKPMATGLLPAQLALKWLLNHPALVPLPGTTTVEEAEENAQVGHLDDFTLTPEEKKRVNLLTERFAPVRCHICWKCEPCPQEIPIPLMLGTDIMYDHYRTMGPTEFRRFPWSQERVRDYITEHKRRLSTTKSCTLCGECEERCPYGLPVIKLLQDMVEPMEEMLRVWEELGLIANK